MCLGLSARVIGNHFNKGQLKEIPLKEQEPLCVIKASIVETMSKLVNCDYTKSKKVSPNYFSCSLCYVSLQVLIAHSLLEWIVDTKATDYIPRERKRVGFMEYRRVSIGSQKLIMGNGTSVEVLGYS